MSIRPKALTIWRRFLISQTYRLTTDSGSRRDPAAANETAARIWALIDSQRSMREIRDQNVEEFEVGRSLSNLRGGGSEVLEPMLLNCLSCSRQNSTSVIQ